MLNEPCQGSWAAGVPWGTALALPSAPTRTLPDGALGHSRGGSIQASPREIRQMLRRREV
jgi:hypothetical protein